MSDNWTETSRHIVKYPDCNATDNLFGGRLMAWIDEGAAIYAQCQTRTNMLVTACMDKLEFINPAPRGSTIRVYCRTAKEGTTSIAVEVKVTRMLDGWQEEQLVSRTELVFVCVDKNGKPTPWGDNDE